MTDTAGEKAQDSRSLRRVVALLAVAVIFILVVVNWLGTSAVPIREDQFAQLLEAELLSAVVVEDDGVEARLLEPVRVESEGGDAVTEQVYLPRSPRPSRQELQDWELRGINVSFRDPTEQRVRNAGGVVVVLILLGIGLWHLWMQVQEDRHGAGSPRRRLRQLDAALAEGTITEEEYRTKAQNVWAEM